MRGIRTLRAFTASHARSGLSCARSFRAPCARSFRAPCARSELLARVPGFLRAFRASCARSELLARVPSFLRAFRAPCARSRLLARVPSFSRALSYPLEQILDIFPSTDCTSCIFRKHPINHMPRTYLKEFLSFFITNYL